MKAVIVTSMILSALTVQAYASELDPGIDPNVPDGLVVRVSEDGTHEVFKASLEKGVVETSADAADVLNTAVKPENQISTVDPVSELDSTTSDESWHFRWNVGVRFGGGHYSYKFKYKRSFYDYYPSYSYSYGGYRYNYYYSGKRYGFRSSIRFSDRYGRHHGRRGWC